jgi:PleD family two-component response regulator
MVLHCRQIDACAFLKRKIAVMCKMHGIRRRARILVVNNDQSNALTLTEILAGHGYEVATAFDGREAVAMATGFSPDLLVTEVCIAKMTGVEVATRVTEMARLPLVSLIPQLPACVKGIGCHIMYVLFETQWLLSMLFSRATQR